LVRSQILIRLVENIPAATRRLSGEKAITLAPGSGSTAIGSNLEAFFGSMTARFSGRNGVLVWVGAMGLVGGRSVGSGVAVSAGSEVGVGEVGVLLAVGMGEGAVLCMPGGVGMGSLAMLQARPGIMALMKKTTNRMRLFFTDASL
jgi:hypothetical protein